MSYETLIPSDPQGTSAGSHRSRSSLDSEAAASAWSNPQDYTLPMAVPHLDMTHASRPLPNYALASSPYAQAPTPWDRTSPSADTMHARSSPVPYHGPSAPPHYDDYAMTQPVAVRSSAPSSYPPGTLPSEQQSYI
ncbi:hypothetical protein ACEQ8H_004255 [Pleosporales sp. CAS-2024a]